MIVTSPTHVVDVIVTSPTHVVDVIVTSPTYVVDVIVTSPTCVVVLCRDCDLSQFLEGSVKRPVADGDARRRVVCR